MQVVISQRMSIPFRAAPIDLYRALRCINPTPYMYFFNFGDFHVVGSRPRCWCASRTIWSPCARSPAPARAARPRRQDLALEQDLLADAKELAEHLMLIDLGRNDVGRVASHRLGEAHRENGDRALFQRDAHRLQRHRPAARN
jgi:anthranilate synthase component I